MLKPEEVTGILRQELEGFESRVEMVDVGTVLEVGDGIARVYGLSAAMAGELIEFPGGVMGIVLNLEEDNVGCILLGSDEHIKEGDEVRSTGRIAGTKVGPALFGRVVNPLGEPIDGGGPIVSDKWAELEQPAPGVIERQPVSEPLQTGLKAVDSVIPIGRGQRELIIGDRQIGKSALAIDTIINQKGTGVYCIYVAIGQKASAVARLRAVLEEHGAMEYTCIVVATASDPPALQYSAPYAGCSIGEEIRDNGGHALVVYDDLSKHAVAYREVSLLLRRPPGREAFPGDIFNLHSRLLERAAKLSDERGAGSLTALPIVETQEGDFSAYIPTNLVSITDGQIYLEPDLFYGGQRPAINVGMSVSRVGSAAQTGLMKRVAGRLKLDLASYREYAAFAQFASDLDANTRATLQRGERMMQVLKQPQYAPMNVFDQVITIFAGTSGQWDRIEAERIPELEPQLIKYVREHYPEITRKLESAGKPSDDDLEALRVAIEDFINKHVEAK
ncbi:MAG: F0F1 ATP synthase subunit alpha [Armatimonadia bacterium]